MSPHAPGPRRAAALRAAATLASAGGGARVRAAAAGALFRELANGWDAWYAAFHRTAPAGSAAARADAAKARSVAARLAPLARGGALLELGCGDGGVLALLAARCREVHGVEVSARALALASRRCRGLRNARLSRLRGWSLPFPDASFDAVVSQRTLHVLDPEGAFLMLAEARRVLRPGGRLAFNLPSFYHDAHLLALTTPGLGVWPALTRPRFWTPGMIRAALPRLGLRLDSLAGGAWLDVVASRAG